MLCCTCFVVVVVVVTSLATSFTGENDFVLGTAQLRHSEISPLGSLIPMALITVIELLCMWVQCILNLAFPVVKCLDIMLIATVVVHPYLLHFWHQS